MTDLSKNGDTLGSPALIPFENGDRRYLHNQRIGKVKFKSQSIDKIFLYFLMRTNEFRHHVLNGATGSTVRHTAPSRLAEYKISIPPIFVQQRIANILSVFEEKIELSRQINRTLEQIARALFKSWFIDFDPVQAKQRGEQPAGMDAETAALFPDRFVEIDGKEVPEGWEWKTVDQLYTLRGGSTPSTSNPEFWEGGTHAWTSPKDLSGLTTPFLTRTEKRITEAGTKVISSGVLPEGTVLLSSRAPVGYLAIASMPVSINQGYIALESTGALGRYFTLNLLQARLEEIKAMASGTTFPELSKKTFRTFAVLSPPRALCDAFEGAVSGLYEALLQNVHEIDQLASLRDSLLPRLLSGELDVSDWENAVEAPEGAPA